MEEQSIVSATDISPITFGMEELAEVDLLVVEYFQYAYSIAQPHLTVDEARDVRARWDGDTLFAAPRYTVAVIHRAPTGRPYIARTMQV